MWKETFEEKGACTIATPTDPHVTCTYIKILIYDGYRILAILAVKQRALNLNPPIFDFQYISFSFFYIWVLRPFQEYFTYIEPVGEIRST